MGQEIPSFLPFITATFQPGMSDEHEIHTSLANRADEAFCAAMRKAIEAGLESAPMRVVTTPGTKNPRYIATEHCPLIPSPGAMDF